MDELTSLKKILADHRAKHPRTKKYPKEFWEKAVSLSRELSPETIASELSINKGNLIRRMKNSQKKAPKEGKKTSKSISVIQVPEMAFSKKQIILQLPNNITLSIDL